MEIVSELFCEMAFYDNIDNIEFSSADYREKVIEIHNGVLGRYLQELKKYGFNNDEKITKISELKNSAELNRWLEPYKNPKYIKDVYAIFECAYTDMDTIINDIDKYIEKPLQQAFIELYKKGYTTFLSSANYSDLDKEKIGIVIQNENVAYISISDTLPDEILNRNKNFVKDKFDRGYHLCVGITADSLVEDVSEKFVEMVKELPTIKRQPEKNDLQFV